MTSHEMVASRVHRLLQSHDLKVILDCPKGEYRFEYFTTSTKDSRTRKATLQRTYRLVDLKRGTVTAEPWDAYDLAKQTSLVAGLISYSGYNVSRVISGWSITCPSCGYTMSGRHWESVPSTCKARATPKCYHRLDGVNVAEVVFTEEVA